MKDLDRFKEVEREIAAEEETNIDDDRGDDELLERKKQNLRTGGERIQRIRDPNVSIIVPQGLNPDIEAEQEVRELEQKKDFLREYLNISVDEVDGTNSDKFLKNLELRVGKTNKIIGVRWKGKDVIVSFRDILSIVTKEMSFGKNEGLNFDSSLAKTEKTKVRFELPRIDADKKNKELGVVFAVLTLIGAVGAWLW